MEDVNELYKKLLKSGRTPKDAAREAQQRTGFSLVTGAPIRHKKASFSSRAFSYGDETFKKKMGASFGIFGN